ncbi:MAG TPA: tetratricopeptide repeat protein [Bacteroidia bacterium]|nr:tetratricopeptide repeat protein [Bacteroidia bacterium]
MTAFTYKHIIVFGLAASCIVLLNLVPTFPSEGKNAALVKQQQQQGPGVDELVKTARSKMAPDLAGKVTTIENAIATERDFSKRGQMYDSLITLLGRNKEYLVAAWYAEQKAVKNNGSGSDWEQAGERYRTSASFEQNDAVLPSVYAAAMRCFSKALELEPSNVDAKIGLGICYVEGTSDPMTGIGMLLDVERADSTNVNVQLALADFAVRSQQYDKAIARYSKALRLKPEYYGLHLNLAELYQQMGDTASAISHLEEYVKLENDPLVKNDVENAIRQLRGNKQ